MFTIFYSGQGFLFCHGLRRRLKAMALAPPCFKVRKSSSQNQTRTNMPARVCNCNTNEGSDNRQEQTCCQDIATVCINNSQCLGLGGPWLSAVSALVLNGGPDMEFGNYFTRTDVFGKDFIQNYSTYYFAVSLKPRLYKADKLIIKVYTQ